MKQKTQLALVSLFIFIWLSSVNAESMVCPTAKASKPVFVTQTIQNQKTVVCGDPTQSSEKHPRAKAVQIFHLTEDGNMTGPVFSSELEFELHEKRPGVLTIKELAYADHEMRPVFEKEISCVKAGCSSGKEKCIFKKLRFEGRDALLRIRSFQNGSKKGTSPDAQHIKDLADEALSGDESAQAVFLSNPRMVLEGESLIIHEDYKNLIQRLKNSRCL